MADVNRYNGKDTTVVIDDVAITGIGEDGISWEKDEALTEESVGVQGDVIVNEINNNIHTLTLPVQPTSPQLSHLMALKNKKFFAVSIENLKLGFSAGGAKAWIREAPAVALGTEAEDLEFVIGVADGDTEIG